MKFSEITGLGKFLYEFCLSSSRDMLSIFAIAWSWYSEVMESMHPTRMRQVVKNPKATHITVHWDFFPILFWLERDFLGPGGREPAGCNCKIFSVKKYFSQFNCPVNLFKRVNARMKKTGDAGYVANVCNLAQSD